MRTIQDFIGLEEQYNAHNCKTLDITIEHADGVWIWDITGKNVSIS